MATTNTSRPPAASSSAPSSSSAGGRGSRGRGPRTNDASGGRSSSSSSSRGSHTSNSSSGGSSNSSNSSSNSRGRGQFQGRGVAARLSIVSYNVLAPVYNILAVPESIPCKEKHHPLHYRSRNVAILEQLLGPLSADVICLQELWFTDELVDLYDATLRPAYLSIKQKRLHKPDGVAVYVRKMPHIRLLCNWKVAFTDHTEQNCILVHLLVNGHPIIIINAHLTYPHDQDHDTLRQRQCRIVIEQLERYVRKHLSTASEPVPVLLAGDFNGPPGDPVWQFLRERGFTSTYERVNEREAGVTQRTREGICSPVDFIFMGSIDPRTLPALPEPIDDRLKVEVELAVAPSPSSDTAEKEEPAEAATTEAATTEAASPSSPAAAPAAEPESPAAAPTATEPVEAESPAAAAAAAAAPAEPESPAAPESPAPTAAAAAGDEPPHESSADEAATPAAAPNGMEEEAPASASTAAAPAPVGRAQCRFFAAGACRNGDRCTFVHSLVAPPVGPVIFEDGSARVLESVYREGRTAPPRDPPLTIKPAFCYLFPLGVADDSWPANESFNTSDHRPIIAAYVWD